MISSRSQVAEMILSSKVRMGITWAQVAKAVGMSKEWTAAGCLGQTTFSKSQAETIGKIFGLSEDAISFLQSVPYRTSLPAGISTDPLIFRWVEMVNIYGLAIKELINEKFGGGILSAIDFSMDLQCEDDPKGDRVSIIFSGKFLPVKNIDHVL